MTHPNTGAGAGDCGQKPVCCICYEHLKPITEYLQSISLCGHVFHELCLQQWLECCPSDKATCPVCKQSCSQKNLTRLFFSGDATQLYSEVDAKAWDALLGKVGALMGSITSSLQRQQLRIEELDQQLSRNEEVRSENKSLERLVLQKDQELLRKSSECSKLEERSLMLAKEVAALKLSYKELMAQCNSLGTAEARAQQKLDKANEKIKSLKARLQELERAVEEKVNGTLRTFKAPNVLKPERVNIDCVVKNSSSVDNHSANKHLQGDPILPGHFVHEVASRNVSKWCRITEQKASPSVTTRAQINKRSLITVGADGREGRIKVLRAHDQYSDTKEQNLLPKRYNRGANRSGQCQREHFFRKN